MIWYRELMLQEPFSALRWSGSEIRNYICYTFLDQPHCFDLEPQLLEGLDAGQDSHTSNAGAPLLSVDGALSS